MVHHTPRPLGASRLITLASETDFDGWRNAARALALAGVEPEAVSWQVGPGGRDNLFAGHRPELPSPTSQATLTVPRDFVERARTVLRHSDPGRFDVLYRLLVRFSEEPNLLKIATDADVRRFEAMEAAVRRNLPAGSSIPDHIEAAEGTASDMVGRAQTAPTPHHGKVRAKHWPQPKTDDDNSLDDAGSIGELREAAKTCRRCPLWRDATQTVFGEGPEHADVVFVGEQPGDQEDLAGKPFVGPAGRVFDEILHEAEVDRLKVYVTNAVKHFKFEPRGKRRIHSKPNTGEVQACRWWLDKELGVLKPKLAVALGATAALGLLGKAVPVMKMRGGVIEREDGLKVFVTIHPSFILRIREPADKQAERARFLDDMVKIRQLMGAH
jgi:uracil-DNA glycosylase family protein